MKKHKYLMFRLSSKFSGLKLKRITSILILGALFSCLFLICKKTETMKEVRIGLIVPLTGGAAEFGKWASNGAKFAMEELNKTHNQEMKTEYKVIYEDNKMEPKLGLSAYRKLIDVDKVIGVITSGSGVVLSIAPQAERSHVIQINHSAVNPQIRFAGDYTFTLVNDADIEAKNIANLAYNKLGIERLAILYANTAYGVGTKDSLEKFYVMIGGEIMKSIAFPEEFIDIRPQLIQLKSLDPPAVYFIATIKDSGKILKQARELGFVTQWLTYNAFESPEVLQIAGNAADGVIYTSSNLFDLPNFTGKPKDFFYNYMTKYGERPNIYSATAYDAFYILALAYSSTDGSKQSIRDYISSIKDYKGASGVISFDEYGSVEKDVFLKIVKNGEFQIYNLEK